MAGLVPCRAWMPITSPLLCRSRLMMVDEGSTAPEAVEAGLPTNRCFYCHAISKDWGVGSPVLEAVTDDTLTNRRLEECGISGISSCHLSRSYGLRLLWLSDFLDTHCLSLVPICTTSSQSHTHTHTHEIVTPALWPLGTGCGS